MLTCFDLTFVLCVYDYTLKYKRGTTNPYELFVRVAQVTVWAAA